MAKDQRRKQPDKIIRVSGHTFALYNVYDEAERAYMLNYPNFAEHPVYTDEGRPFALSVQEACSCGKHYQSGDMQPYDCNECAYFALDAPGDAIGVCMCEVRRQEKEEESSCKIFPERCSHLRWQWCWHSRRSHARL